MTGTLPQTSVRRDALAGTLAVALMLAGTRWASYIGVPPFFLTDALLLLAGVHFALGRATRPRCEVTPRGSAGWLPWLICAWALTRFAAGGDFGVTALRDVAPYVYVGTAILAALSIRDANAERLERTRSLLFAALAFHAVWFVAVTVFVPWLPEVMPSLAVSRGELHVFMPRPDVDVAVTGVFAAVLLLRLARGASRFRVLSVAMIALCLVAMLSTTSRAGLLGAASVLAFAVYVALGSRRAGGRPSILAAIVPLVLAAAIVVVPATTVGARLAGTVGVTTAEASLGAQGTTAARSTSWERLWDWSTADDTRLLAGVGFGPHFMVESGATTYLVGRGNDEATRSPHNFWLGTLGRLGLVGLVLVGAFALRGLRAAWRSRRVVAEDEFRFILAAVPVALFLPATFGVVLEAPFGAIPFWWCVGALLVRHREVPEPVARVV